MDEIEEQGKEVEIRSEEFQEILGGVPSWILRKGISMLAVIVILLLIGSWVFKYPEIISSPLVLTTSIPPAGIVAKTSGKIIKLCVKDQQVVKNGDCLAIIENPASYDDVIYLENEIKNILVNVGSEKQYYLRRKGLKLGTLQSVFSSFSMSLNNYNDFLKIDYFPRKIKSVKRLIEANRDHYQGVLKQNEIVISQHELNKRNYDREAHLKKQNMISEEESDQAKGQLLQSDMSVQNMQSNLESLRIQILQMEENLVDVEQQYLEKKSSLLSAINASANQFQTEILSWKMSYLLCSPLDGKIEFSKFWCVNQNVGAGEIIFTVIPDKLSELIGIAQLPAEGSGKVKVGQQVQIHFVNYPDTEYGMVVGVVNRISLIPTDGKYNLEIKFPKGLLTTYGKKLPLSHEMAAKADIITKDLRLIDKFILPMKKIFNNNI